MPGPKRRGATPIDPVLVPLWHEVLDLAETLRQAEPWRRSAPNAVLGVRDPATGSIDWCSLVGHDGQVFGVAIYSGDAGYATLHRLHAGEVEEFDEQITQQAIVVSFVASAEVLPSFKSILKALGRSYRGAHAWPEVLRHVPTFMPVPPDEPNELRRLALTLRGLLALTPRLAGELRGGECEIDDHALVVEPPFPPGTVQTRPLPHVEREPVVVPAHDRLAAKRAKRHDGGEPRFWFVDWFSGLGIIDGPEAEGRPYFTAHVLVLDMQKDLLLKVDLCRIDEVPAMLQKLLIAAAANGCPTDVVVRRPAVAQVLQPVAEDLGCVVHHEPDSVAVTRHVFEQTLQFFGK